LELKYLFVCKSKRLANYLIENGSPVMKIDTDQKAKGFLVFLFEKNELLNKNLEYVQDDLKPLYREFLIKLMELSKLYQQFINQDK
jgi:hypothetical protein